MAAARTRRREAGVEPGWQRKHLEREEGGREEERERRKEPDMQTPPSPLSNQNRIPSRLRPVRKETGNEAGASEGRVAGRRPRLESLEAG